MGTHRVLTFVGILSLLLPSSGCAPQEQLACGEGTHEVDGVCLPDGVDDTGAPPDDSGHGHDDTGGGSSSLQDPDFNGEICDSADGYRSAFESQHAEVGSRLDVLYTILDQDGLHPTRGDDYVSYTSALLDDVYFLSDNRLVVASNCQILGLGQVRRLEATLLQALGHLQDATPGIDQNSLIATWLGINDPYNTTPAEVPIQFYAQAEGVFQRTYMPTDLVYSNALTGIVTVPEPSPYHLRFALGGYEGRDLGATLLWDGEYVMQQEYLAPGQVLFLETWELPPNRGAHSMSYQESGWASPLDTGTRFFDLVTHEETAGTITLTMDSGQIGRTLRAQPIGDSALPE